MFVRVATTPASQPQQELWARYRWFKYFETVDSDNFSFFGKKC